MPKIDSQGYETVINDKSWGTTNWCILSYEKPNLVDTATGWGIEALSQAFDPTKIQYACLKVIGCDNRDSVEAKRDKYIMICWVGEKVSPMKKLGALESKKDAVTLFRGTATTLDINDVNDINVINFSKELLTAGAAHKPTAYDFGDIRHEL